MKLVGKPVFFFFAAIVLLHIAAFFLALHFQRIYMGDSYEYVYMALNIKDQFLFYSANASLPLEVRNYTLRPPGYSLFLLVVYVFSVNNWLVLVLQNLISIGNVFLLRKTLCLLGYNTRYDWLLLLLILVYPAQFIYANTIAPDLLVQSCVLVYFWSVISFLQKRQTRFLWLMSLALTYGLFTKPVLYLFVPLHVLAILWLCFRYRLPRFAFLSWMLPVLSILIYNTWNLQRTGKFHFTSIQPWNGMYYNVRMYQEHQLGMQKATAFMEDEERIWNQSQSFAEWYDYGNKHSLEFLKSHFISYMIFHGKYGLQFFIHPGKGEIDLFTGELTYGNFYKKDNKRILQVLKETPVREWPVFFRLHPSVPIMFVVLLFNGLKVVGAIAFMLNRRVPRSYRFSVLILLGYFAFLTGPLANTRYHLPVSLLFIGCSVLGFQRLLQSKNNERIITTQN